MAENITFTAPSGSTNHGNPNLICLPTQWYDVIVFFLTNYFAHAASIIVDPGADLHKNIAVILSALVLPGSGYVRAVLAIRDHAATEINNPLRRAARAGALCMVLRTPKEKGRVKHIIKDQRRRRDKEQESRKGRKRRGFQWWARTVVDMWHESFNWYNSVDYSKWWRTGNLDEDLEKKQEDWWDPHEESPQMPLPVPAHYNVHGEFWLHKDYYLATVPLNACLDFSSEPKGDDPGQGCGYGPSSKSADLKDVRRALSSTYNAPKVLVSIIQAVWGIITIYRARGDQIQIYGYAAFGLTVVPYAYMSILNSLANLLTPSYPALILIKTPILQEAQNKGKGIFSGVLPVITKPAYRVRSWMNPKFEKEIEQSRWTRVWRSIVRFAFLFSLGLLIFIFSLIPLVVVGALTGFEAGSSTPVQRGFTMAWLAVGILVGIIMPDFARTRRRLASQTFDTLLTVVMYAPVSVGGMVVVGQMLREYGVCTLIY
ncbi:hypothetical protein MMC10_007696 [Thelotrema lepadinum]|nr:hypothetical protein [Thelotrema lepadinum]